MKRVLLPVVLAVLGLLAGVGLAGWPETVRHDVRAVDIPPSTSSTTTLPPTTTTTTTRPPTTTTTTRPPTTTTTTTTTLRPATTLRPTTSTTERRTLTTASTTTVRTVTTSTTEVTTTVPETTQVTTTEVTTTTTTEPPTTTARPIRPVTEVVLLVVNASETFGLGTRTRANIRELGYVFVDRTDGVRELSDTVLYYGPGFEGEAARLAVQIGFPFQRLEPLPDGTLWVGDFDPELVLMLGHDWSTVTNLT